jgi:hypothetical protein
MSEETPNQYAVVMTKLYRIQCMKGRIHYAVFKAECNVRGDTAMSLLYDRKSSTVYKLWVMMRERDTVLDVMKPRWVKFAMWNKNRQEDCDE